MKKRHTAAFKAKVVQELLKEEKPLREIAARYGVHPSQLSKWKTTAVQGLPSLFENTGGHQERERDDREREMNELYAEIGRLTTQLAWIKKKSGLDI
jgi:transposase-like protein